MSLKTYCKELRDIWKATMTVVDWTCTYLKTEDKTQQKGILQARLERVKVIALIRTLLVQYLEEKGVIGMDKWKWIIDRIQCFMIF